MLREFHLHDITPSCSEKIFRLCGHHKLASAFSHAVDSEAFYDSWIRTCRNSKLFAAQPRTVSALEENVYGDLHAKRPLFLQRLAPNCSQMGWNKWTLQCVRNSFPKAAASRSECCSSRDPLTPHRFPFALAMVLTMHARRCQGTHPLSGMGSSLSASRGWEAAGESEIRKFWTALS